MSFGRGAHVCHLFNGFNEQKAVALSFLLEGLNQGEACLYVSGRQSVDDWCFELQASGIDVVRERKREALTITTGAEYRQPTGFNSILKARELLSFIEDRLVDFPGVRIAGDVAWEADPALPADLLCHWEATANLVFQDQDVRAICQYSLSSDSPSVIHAALRTHPLVILAGRTYANPIYEAPRILHKEPSLNRSEADAQGLIGLLKRIQSTQPLDT